MGFESFRVELRGGRATYREVDEIIRRLPHVQLDPQSVLTKGSTCYVMNDGRHVIEMELMDAPVHLSCRFTLCHPDSVDSAFLGLVRELMARLDMQAKICDDVRPEHEHSYSLADYSVFSEATTPYIAARRAEWIAAFGTEQLAASTNEVYQWIILPQCQPGFVQPGQSR
jgi:hypothetical protein